MTQKQAYDLPFRVNQSLHEAKTKLINQIYDDFDKELEQAWIDGSDANYKALKESGKLK